MLTGARIGTSVALQVAIVLGQHMSVSHFLKCSAKQRLVAQRGQTQRMQPALRHVSCFHPSDSLWNLTVLGNADSGEKREKADLPKSSGLKGAGVASTKSLSGGKRKAENKN